jgi:hypothetical protein
LEAETALGGAEGLKRLLAAHLVQDIEVAQVRVDFSLPAAEWECAYLRPGRPEAAGAALELARTVYLEQVGFRFDGGAEGIEEVEITYDHQDPQYFVRARVRTAIRLDGDTWMPTASTAMSLLTAKLFSATVKL